MRSTPLTPAHELLLAAWKLAHNQMPVGAPYWPKHGRIVFDKDNKPLAAAFLFCTDGALCMVDWVISNPSSDKIERREGVKQLISELYALGKELGYPLGYAVIQKSSLVKTCKELGFDTEYTDLTGMIKEL